MSPKKIANNLQDLYQAALQARSNAHAPHSKYRVGAAIRLKNGQIVSGCNVENSSYGATVCAERGAIQTAVCKFGKLDIQEILVITDANPPWMPCGLCRQVISEFVEDCPIHATNMDGDCLTMSFREIMPKAFSPKELHEGKQGR